MKCAYCGRDATEIIPNKISSTDGEIDILYIVSNMSLACPRCIVEEDLPLCVHDYSILKYDIPTKSLKLLDPACKNLLIETNTTDEFRHNLSICIELCLKYKAREQMLLT